MKKSYKYAIRAKHVLYILTETQMLNHLNERMLTFIPQQEMLFISTADATGHCDASIRVGPKGLHPHFGS